MSGEAAARLYATQYQPSAEDLRRALPEVGRRTEVQLVELHGDITPERCERMLIELEGVRQLVSRLRQAIGEGSGDGR